MKSPRKLITNAAPLIRLGQADLLEDLLKEPAGMLHTTDGVYHECVQLPGINYEHVRIDKPDSVRIAKAVSAGWLQVHNLTSAQRAEAEQLSMEIRRRFNLRVEVNDAKCMILQKLEGGVILYANTQAEQAARNLNIPYISLSSYLRDLSVDRDRHLYFVTAIYNVGYRNNKMRKLIEELGGTCGPR